MSKKPLMMSSSLRKWYETRCLEILSVLNVSQKERYMSLPCRQDGLLLSTFCLQDVRNHSNNFFFCKSRLRVISDASGKCLKYVRTCLNCARKVSTKCLKPVRKMSVEISKSPMQTLGIRKLFLRTSALRWFLILSVICQVYVSNLSKKLGKHVRNMSQTCPEKSARLSEELAKKKQKTGVIAGNQETFAKNQCLSLFRVCAWKVSEIRRKMSQ